MRVYTEQVATVVLISAAFLSLWLKMLTSILLSVEKSRLYTPISIKEQYRVVPKGIFRSYFLVPAGSRARTVGSVVMAFMSGIDKTISKQFTFWNFPGCCTAANLVHLRISHCCISI